VSKRVSLRDFQETLSSRIRAAAGKATPSARLSFEAGGTHWLVRLESAGEVLVAPEIARVPLTQPWFLGVANVRGVLFGVTDFAAFLGAPLAARGIENRLLLIGQPHGINAALLVTRLTGLRNLGQFERARERGAAAKWADKIWRDAEGRIWHELDSTRLLSHREYLDVAMH